MGQSSFTLPTRRDTVFIFIVGHRGLHLFPQRRERIPMPSVMLTATHTCTFDWVRRGRQRNTVKAVSAEQKENNYFLGGEKILIFSLCCILVVQFSLETLHSAAAQSTHGHTGEWSRDLHNAGINKTVKKKKWLSGFSQISNHCTSVYSYLPLGGVWDPARDIAASH